MEPKSTGNPSSSLPPGKVRLQFLGATGYVTGSRTLLETPRARIYIDSGLYQGPSYVQDKNYEALDLDASSIDAVILTHAHIDHSGLLPLLVKKGFAGVIYTTPATRDLLEVLLPDAAHILREDFKFLSKKKIRDFHLFGPLYDEEDVKKTLERVHPVEFAKEHQIKDMTFSFHWAGHILGAAYVHIKVEGESPKTFLFSGDIGPRKHIFHNNREKPPRADFVIMESTYGMRRHEKENYMNKLRKSVEWIKRKKGMLLIPSFAVGRTQLVLYVLFKLWKLFPELKLQIFVDSPMATRATRLYMNYPHEIKQEIIHEGFMQFLQSRDIQYIEDVGESKYLNYFNGPGILISASGMCNGGRIVHHLYNRLWDSRNMVLFVGYQAEGTLGRQILEGANRVKIFNREIPVRTKLETINSFSAHTDKRGLEAFAKDLNAHETPPEIIFINHGEDEPRYELQKTLVSFMEHTKIEIPKSEAVYYL